MNTSRLISAAAILASLVVGSASAQNAVPLAPLKVFDPSYMDASVSACTDFFQFANGGWLKRDTIPAAFSTSGVAKDMTDRNEIVVRSVLADAMAHRASAPGGSTERKLGTFYASCMDSTSAESAGIKPIQPELNRIAAVNSRADLVREIAALQPMRAAVLFRYSPSSDPKDATHYIVDLNQGGLGMPDRDYYLKTDPRSDSLRRKYVGHVARVLSLAGENATDASADAGRVMALETELAKASMTRIAQREPSATYHKTMLPDLQKLVPAIDWPAYFKSIGVTSTPAFVNVGQPDYFRRANELLNTVPLEDWRAYMRYHLIDAAAGWLSTPFVNEDFAYSSIFSGARAMQPRWRRCLRVTDSRLGEALGQAYVNKTFSPKAKADAKQVIDDIRASFRDRINALAWMSDSTRRYALEKLALMNEKIGYPDKWRDYSALQVSEGPFASNILSANTFAWNRIVDRPGKSVDKTEWGMTVPTVNAYYDPSLNEMLFPAGALLPQTFDASGDMASNYGALGGSWAGHELTHGFDDEGRHYDAQGNLRDWWTSADSASFGTQAKLMSDQFSSYVQVDTLHVNGGLTLGENIADYGGLLTAYDALERALNRTGKRDVIDGYTPEQRFFIAYAQTWREHTRPEQLRSRVLTDPHAPAYWRTNGPVSNMESFAKAFGCKPGDPMVRSSAVVPRIW
ncbi:MAG: M13 family metallopeptidase [Gemmatimonadota bacterium]|nr:M13 family metallopeptidase [Gemmatimonadota bacterium]